MADKTDDLIISISTDLATVRRQLKQLEGLIANAGNNAGKSFTAAGKKMDAALSPVQERINKLTGAGASGTKEWSGALATQGQELQRLRAKYNPLFAAQQTYLANLRDIKQAHAIGAISAQEMGAAITREKAAFASNVAVINGTRGALTKVSGAAKLTSTQMLNLSRQGNDVITMFALGAAPMQIFASQAGQIYDALEQGPGGVRGSLKALGTQLVSLIARFPLATAGIAAAGAAIVAYNVLGGEEIEDLNKVLERHEKLIGEIQKAYGDAALAAKGYASGAAGELELRLAASVKELRLRRRAELQNLFGEDSPLGGGTYNIDVPFVANTEFKQFQEQILRLYKEGAPALQSVRQAIIDIGTANGAEVQAKKLLDLLDGVFRLDAEIQQASQGISEVEKTFTELGSAIDGVKVSGVHDQLTDLYDKAKDGKLSVEDVATALQTLSNTNLDLSGQIGQLQGLFDAAIKARSAVANTQVLPTLGTIGPVYSAGGEFIDESQLQTVRANATKSLFEQAQEKAAKAGRKKGKTDAEKQADAIKSVTDSLKFEIEQLGRSSREQEIYNSLKQAGVGINTEAGRSIAELAGKNYDLEEAQKAATKAQEDFANGLEQLESDTIDALGNVIAGTEDAADAFKKLAIEIVKSALTGKGAYSDLFKSLGGGGGGGGGLLSMLFGGFGGGSSLSPAVSSVISAGGVGLFASGGVSHKPAIFGEAGPEAAVPLPDGRRIPVDLRMPALAQRAGVSGSVTVYFNPTIDNRGASVEAVARNEATLNKLKAELPAHVTAAVRKAQKSNVKLG